MALDIQGTDYLKLPVGTTAQRPSVPASGMIRQNSTTGFPEWYDSASAAWIQFNQGPAYSINFLIAGGGGSGGSYYGGGGGAGGFLTGTITVASGTSYPITVGAGGASSSSQAIGSNGTSSVFSTYGTATGGGGGGSQLAGSYNGLSGASGGGGANSNAGGSGTGAPADGRQSGGKIEN